MQWMHRDVPEVKRFRNTNGFDDLVQIKGLERINIIRGNGDVMKDIITQKEVDAFAGFLNSVMTQPKPQPEPRTVSPKKLK